MNAALIAILLLMAVVGAANWLLIESVVKAEPGSWEDLAVIVCFGPLVNALLFPLALLFCGVVRRQSGRMWAILFIVASTAVPLLGYGVDYLLITGHHLR